MNKQYFLWGGGGLGRRMFERFPPQTIKGVIDSDKEKLGKRIGEFAIIPYDKKIVADYGVIVGFFDSGHVEETLRADGIPFIKPEQFYTEWYWEIYCQNALTFVDLPITSRCTLNCAYCMQYLPLRYNKGDIAAENIVVWWENLLLKFPKVMEVSIMGGEPFLHPNLDRIIEYVANSTDISIVVTTNGTVMPNDRVVVILKKYDVFVSISDYSKTLSQIAVKVDEFENRLKRNHIRTERKTHHWIDQGRFDCDVAGIFDDCARTHFQLEGNKLWYCTLQCAGNKAGLCSSRKGTDYVDLSAEYTPLELYEFSNGNTKTTVCSNCGSRLRKRIPVAEQI